MSLKCVWHLGRYENENNKWWFSLLQITHTSQVYEHYNYTIYERKSSLKTATHKMPKHTPKCEIFCATFIFKILRRALCYQSNDANERRYFITMFALFLIVTITNRADFSRLCAQLRWNSICHSVQLVATVLSACTEFFGIKITTHTHTH